MVTAARSGEVAEQLRTGILDGTYPPGAPLREVTLAARYSASRRTIREALLVLSDQGLAAHRHNTGAAVRQLTRNDIEDLYRVRRMLECEGARGVLSADDPQLAVVDSAYSLLAAAALRGITSVALARADVAFHGAVIGLTGSPQIDAFYERIGAQMSYAICLLQRRAHALSVSADIIVAEHRAIRDAILDRDSFHAQRLILEHIGRHEQNLLISIETSIRPPATRPHPSSTFPQLDAQMPSAGPTTPTRAPGC